MAEKVIRTIGVLTSGGDAPGMNAAVRAVARIGKERGLKVKGTPIITPVTCGCSAKKVSTS